MLLRYLTWGHASEKVKYREKISLLELETLYSARLFLGFIWIYLLLLIIIIRYFHYDL